MPLTPTVLDVARHHPHRVAIAEGDRSLNYAELADDSRRLFAAVTALHDAPPDPPIPAREARGIPITATSLTSAFQTARIMAGLAGYRAVSATIDPRWPLMHRVSVIATTGIGVVVVDSNAERDSLAAALCETGWGGTIVTIDELRDRERTATAAVAPTARDGDEPFLLLFSSGTTNHPKAFIKTREQYRQNVAVSSAHLEPLPDVATLAPGPVSYSLTLYAVIECLATGGSVVVADAFDPIEVGRTIETHGVTRIVAVPAMIPALAAAARRDPGRFASLELIVTGGAHLSVELRNMLATALPGARLISYYGAAEIGFIGDSRSGDGTVMTLYPEIDAQLRREDGSVIEAGGSGGRVIRPGSDDDRDTGPGSADDVEIGTIWIRAAACSDGYVTGTSDEQLRDPDGWATVYDQGRWVTGHGQGREQGREQGRGAGARLELLGRAGDIAITSGHKVSLTEVERAFETLPGASAVCAIAVPDRRRGSVIGLAIERAVSDAAAAEIPDKAALVGMAREALAPQFRPRRWYVVDRLPRTVGGKIRRGAAAELVIDSGTDRAEVIRL